VRECRGSTWVRREGKAGVGEKRISFFGRNALQIVIVMVVPHFWSSGNMTGGSSVRGKAGPNWVRKVFNYLRSL
jgi:hypothetical protein